MCVTRPPHSGDSACETTLGRPHLGDSTWESTLVQEIARIREMGVAARNLAPWNHILGWIVKPSGCHCTDGHLTSRRVFTEDLKSRVFTED